MELREAITGRRHIKQFQAEAIEESKWLGWLEDARYAPSHRMTEPWRVFVVGPQTRALLAHPADFGGAPVVLAVLAAPGRSQEETDENIVTASCFAQNLCLAAYADGYGTRWASIGYSERGRQVLGIPDDHAVIGVIAIGRPAEVPAAKPRKPLEETLTRLP